MTSAHRDFEHGLRSMVLQTGRDPEPGFHEALHSFDACGVLDGPLTFAPASSLTLEAWNTAWTGWLAGPFYTSIAPALLAVANLTHAGKLREIVGLDQALHAAMDPETAERCVTSGRKLLKRLGGVGGVRWVKRLQSAAEADETTGTFPVVFACQAALFHLSPRLMLTTYAYWEWSAAMVAGRKVNQKAASTFEARSAVELQRILQALLPPLALSVEEPRRASL